MADKAPARMSVSSTRKVLEDLDWEIDEPRLEEILADRRSGLRALGERVLARRARRQAEEKRLHRMLRTEAQLWSEGISWVAGVDEAGRGPLAGPVVAAAVILHPGSDLPGVDDSKRLSPERRERLFPTILSEARFVGVGVVQHGEIDSRNIRQAAFLAMRKALRRLPQKPEVVLVDGEAIPGLRTRQRGIPHGDRLCLSIAAASVVAKVVRDRIMVVLDRKYPGYGFARHKGYGTAEHGMAIARLGLCPIHRRTFCSGALEAGSTEPHADASPVDERHEFGREGERAAVRYLEARGYRVLDTNYRWQRAEIDIIAREEDHLVFIEVKARKDDGFGSPEGAVDRRKQEQIAKVAAHYVQKHGLEDVDCRFDVLALREIPGSAGLSVDHFKNAFWIERRFVL